MEADFWHERWQQGQIGFHQAKSDALLQKHWPQLALSQDATVFVPLAGKSLDMTWLAGLGHKVIGNELSQIAVDEFFQTLNLSPEARSEAGFTVKSAGPYEIWCGDYFELPAEATSDVMAIYDRAALIALPPDMRQRYARKLTEIAADRAGALLITLEYDQSVLPGPPHSVPAAEVHDLFDQHWEIEEVTRQQAQVRSPKFKEHGLDTVGETVYIMTPHAMQNATSQRGTSL